MVNHVFEAPVHHRIYDPLGPFRITREIPLWGIVSVLGTLAIQAVMIWAGQREHGHALTEMAARLAEQTKQIQVLSARVEDKNLKDTEHDLKIADHERRLSTLERGPRR